MTEDQPKKRNTGREGGRKPLRGVRMLAKTFTVTPAQWEFLTTMNPVNTSEALREILDKEMAHIESQKAITNSQK